MEQKLGPCSYGSETHPAEKVMSGTPICWKHWNLVKLDLPAAEHWSKVAEAFLSNVDMYDVMTYLPACGLTQDEMSVMLASARKVLDHSNIVKTGN